MHEDETALTTPTSPVSWVRTAAVATSTGVERELTVMRFVAEQVDAGEMTRVEAARIGWWLQAKYGSEGES